MPWILHDLSERWDQLKLLPHSTLLVFHLIQPRKAYSNHKSALILLQKDVDQSEENICLAVRGKCFQCALGKFSQSKSRSRGKLWLASASQVVWNGSFLTYLTAGFLYRNVWRQETKPAWCYPLVPLRTSLQSPSKQRSCFSGERITREGREKQRTWQKCREFPKVNYKCVWHQGSHFQTYMLKGNTLTFLTHPQVLWFAGGFSTSSLHCWQKDLEVLKASKRHLQNSPQNLKRGFLWNYSVILWLPIQTVRLSIAS